jgi:predicted acylesterase/phospholipase RssA
MSTGQPRIHERVTRTSLVLAALTIFAALLSLASLSCAYMKTGFVLDTLNTPTPAKPGAPTVDVPTRIARLTRDSLADSYLDPGATAAWMKALGADVEPLARMTTCLTAPPGVNAYSGCYDRFVAAAVTGARWGVPPLSGASGAIAAIDAAAPSRTEIDAERFLANAMSIGPSLAALTRVIGTPIAAADLGEGIARGAADAASYVTARRWHRELGRPTNALVLSGGSANGAFTAGSMWRLFEILDACRGVAGGGCGDARIDLVAGTSTGSLIGVLVDMYFTRGMERRAKDLLVQNYTCTVASDLYCLHSTWDWELATNLRGLVHFDGIHDRLDKAMGPELAQNGTELVTVSVDYASGDVYGVSDQDPIDSGPSGATPDAEKERHEGRINAVMASIVEPVLADPVDWLPARGKRVTGTFIDGGIRSGLPVLQATQRGAERVLLFSNSGIEPDRIANPENAFGVLMRSLDLMVGQPRVGEVQQGELGAVARRFAEYNVCEQRIGMAAASASAPADRADPATIRAFCLRKGGAFMPPRQGPRTESAASMWMGAGQFEQVATSWRSAWVYRPEERQAAAASGYAFTPKVMRPLFESGVETFQKRCAEILDLFGIYGDIATGACAEPVPAVVARARAAYASEASCTDGKPARRTCD